ncbi:tetratricopeptide repeat protein [Wolbachia endosymbiont (group B) of Dolichovespula media]|uniref:tetratricopeptide repeat protein n=1 Tax=Wolbachia endosymbiont (group B) of Dolichovespula media TaxID=2954001 RepID=UPI0021F8B896|nr:tetratricopeptide repeat protein [Wolbachia endosymbiont (group B) of Dolichovespula media]
MQDIKTNPQATSSDREEKSFQFKNRIRRQYNPNDINVAKLFLAIREHRTDNPQLNKISEIEGLLTQVENINDIDLNDGGNTPLHVAVSKNHQDIVELLLNVSGIDPNIKNNQGKTPLDIAKQQNKGEIIRTLEEHLKKFSDQVKGLSAQEEEVHEKLRKFVEDFVFIYERSLSEYYKRLENQRGKQGKWADFVNMIIYIGKGGTEQGEAESKVIPLIGINILRATISSIGSSYNRAELKKLIDQLYIFKKDPIKVREELVKSGIEIFQSFESQFIQVTAEGSWRRAMTKLAEDAVNRVVDYYRKNTEKELCASSITEGIIFGESKRYKQTYTGVPHIKLGHTLESKNSWNTAEIFDKAGLVTIKSDGRADKYYRRIDGKSDTSKYGYRLLLKWELENKIKKFMKEYSEENPPREEYRYVLKSDGKTNEEWEDELLNEINKQDPKLVEERLLSKFKGEMEQEAEKNFNELEDYIGKNFNELSGYIESNQNEIKGVFDELMSQYQEASRQRHKIADSIVEGRKESEKSFEKIDKKLDKIYDAIVAREPIWFNVKKPVILFAGRREELIDLHNKIQRSSEKVTVISQITSISGLGGIGKTELARQYVQEYSKDCYDNVIWINAESEIALVESFTRLAKNKLRIDIKDENGKEKDIKALIEEVYEFFSNSKSLFIFDDAEKSNYLNKFLPIHDSLPGGNGPYILITSRNREWERGIEVINLNELKSEEAIEFVKKGFSIEDESQNEKIKALVEKLQHFPLAIQQAISYIEDQRVTRKFDIDDYLKEYEKKAKDLLNYEGFRGIDNNYAKTTFTTWKITTDKIASNEKHGNLALRILDVISYLAPDNISREFFLDLTGNNEEELRSAVRLLIKYSMVNGEQEQGVLSIHKLVQEVTKIALEEEGKSEEVMKETFELLRASFPYGSDKLEDYLKKRELLPHLEAFLSRIDSWLKKNPQDKEKIEKDYLENLLILMSNGYLNLGNPKRQKELLERTLPILKNHYGEDHFEVAITLVNLSISYIALGDYERAKELLERALPILENYYGEDHFQVAIAKTNQGITYIALDDYGRAEELLERALPILENHYGENHVEVAKILVNLSNIYRYFDDYQGAKELLERALPILEKHYGEEHFEIGMILESLGTDYIALGDNQEAKEVLERALSILEKYHERDHVEVSKILVNLSIAYRGLGDTQGVKKLLERALPILEKHYGENHFEIAIALANLSNAYETLGDYEEAKDLLEKALPVLENYYGAEHFKVGIMLEDLGMYYLMLGDSEEAKEVLERALSILEKCYGAEHFEVAKTLVNLSISYEVLGYYQKQKGLLERALPILEKHYGENHFEVAIALEDLAIADGALGNVQRAKELLERVSVIYQRGKVEECLPSTSSGKSKREAKIGECKLSWEDVDEFNTEKDEKRDFSKIKIDSKKFIDYIKDIPEEKRSQLIELADKVQVKGRFSNLVNKLTSNQKVMNHLNRVKKISSITMHGMIAKNILADFLTGDYQGVAINVGFIAGGQGFAKVAEVASRKGLNLLSEEKVLLGRSLRVASPFLARGTSAFIIYDLVNQVKAFKNGTEGALVGVVGDSIYLGVDAAEIGIEVAEGFEVLEGVSSITGPIGAGVGTAVFIYTDIYMAVKRVDKIDEIIHLTRGEKFIEGLRAFIGMRPEQYVEKLMEEKQLYNQLVKQGFEYLKEYSDIQSYVFPTGKSVVNSCRKVLHTTSLGIRHYYTEECTTKFEIDLDSTVLLDRKRNDIKWSRARPNNPSGGKLFCLPKGDDEPAPSYGSYLCKNAIGLSDNKIEGYTLINLGEGEDYAKGFKDSSNIFVVNDGSKEYYGGNKNDIFVLQGDLIEGSLYGEDGIDTLDLTEFAQEAVSVNVYLNTNIGTIMYNRYGYSGFQINSVERVLGRKAKADHIFSACETKFLDGNGGKEDQLDYLEIKDNNCVYDIQVIVRNYTEVNNLALKGNFNYIVPFQKGSASVKLLANFENNHRFIFDYLLADIQNIDIKDHNSIKFDFSSKVANSNFSISISYNIMNNIIYQLKDSAEIKVGKERNLYAIQNTNKTIDEIIESYPAIANKLNMTIAVQDGDESILVGYGKCEVIYNNPIYNSHLIGNGGKNIYVITIASGEQRYEHNIFSMPQINIYNPDQASSIDTLDLRNVIKIIQDDLKIHINLPRIFQDGNDLLVKLETEVKQSFLLEVPTVEVLTIRLRNGLDWYGKLCIISDSAPMKISSELELKPLPLIFEKDKEIIVVTGQDVEKDAELITPRKGGNNTFVRSNGHDLIITNAFDSTITKDDFCSITLSKFYKTPKMKTLSIKFTDKEIVLKDYEKEISTARDVNVVKKEYKDQVYDDVFTEVMLSDQPHRHRQHIRNRRSEYTMSSGTRRPSSWINDLFGWVKSSVSGLLDSRAALPETSANYSNTSGTSQFSSEVCISNNFGLGFFLLQSFLDKKYPLPKFCSATHEEVLADTLNIMEEFKKTLKKTAKQSGVSAPEQTKSVKPERNVLMHIAVIFGYNFMKKCFCSYNRVRNGAINARGSV